MPARLGNVSDGKLQSSPLTTLPDASSPHSAKDQTYGLANTVTAIARNSPLSFHNGFVPVFTGIIAKMDPPIQVIALTDRGTSVAGLAAGVTEAVTVVTPMEVLKARLQVQKISNKETGDVPRYRNAAQTAYLIAREEGPLALFKGVT